MKLKKSRVTNDQPEDLEIEDLLKDFEGEAIYIPEERLERALEEKMKCLQPQKKNPLAKIAAGIGLVLLAGSFTLPQLQVFAQEILESIFKDRGIENAAQSGYPGISDVEGKIGAYQIRLTNIYIDTMRLSFNIEILGLPEDQDEMRETVYFCNIADEWQIDDERLEVFLTSSSFSRGESTSIEIIGEDVSRLLAEEEIQIPFILTSNQYDSKGPNNQAVLGETTLTLTIRPELHKAPKLYEIHQEIKLKTAQMSLETLKVAPTMMTLDFKSQLEGGYITGLENIKLKGKHHIYEEGINLGATYDEEGGFRATMVPSIYFESEKHLTLQADGYWYKPNEMTTLTIKPDDEFPKEIIYEGIPLKITMFDYRDGLLEIGIVDEAYNRQNFSDIYINGITSQSMEVHTYRKKDEQGKSTGIEVSEYLTKIKVPKADTYELGFDYNRYQEQPISIEFDLKATQ